MSEFIKSSESSLLDGDIVIHAPPKNGKTFLAASASEFYPENPDLSQLKKKTVLEDMLWHSFDKGALDGFKGANIVIPHQIDCTAVHAKYPSVADALSKIRDLTKELVQKYQLKYLVGDTVSQLDKTVVGYYSVVHEDNPNTFAVYKDVFSRMKRYYADCAATNLKKIWLFHSKAVIEASLQTKDQNNRKAASDIPGGDMITPDITGQARTVFIGNASLELVIRTVVLPGKDKKNLKRTVYPFGNAGFEGSNRFHHVLGLEEPAHLGQIFKKIRA